MKSLELTNFEVQIIYNALLSLYTQELPFSTAIKVQRNVKKLVSIDETIKNEVRELLDKYCEKDENGEFVIAENGGVKIIPDKSEELNENHKSLMAIENTVDLYTFNFADFEGVKIKPSSLEEIEKLIEEDGE